MTNTISVPRELRQVLGTILNALDRDALEGKTVRGEMAQGLRALLSAPAVEVEGLEVIGFHCMDSAGIETLEWRGGSYADEPLCSLPKAQKIIDQLKADSEVVTDLAESRLAENLRLKAENERLKLRLWDLEHSEVDHVLKERDTLRKQLDEARELLKDYGYAAGDLDGRVDAWLEATGNR